MYPKIKVNESEVKLKKNKHHIYLFCDSNQI